MPTEATGFEPEPELDLTAHAEAEQLRERLYAAQNVLVRLQNERAGIAADLQVVLRGQEWRMLNGTGEFRQAFEGLLDVAWPRSGAPGAASPGYGSTTGREAVSVALSAVREPTWTTTRPALAEALTAAMAEAGVVMVRADDLRLILGSGPDDPVYGSEARGRLAEAVRADP